MSESMILGTREKDYYIQTNNRQRAGVSCGFSSAVMGLSTCGYDLSKIPGDEAQPEDKLNIIAMSESNWPIYAEHLRQVRETKTDYEKVSFRKANNPTLPFEFPEIIAFVINQVFGEHTAFFRYGWNDHARIVKEIDAGGTVVICGDFTPAGHYVLVCGYGEDNTLIINDPYPPSYKSGDGYNKMYKQLNIRTLENNPDAKSKKKQIKLQTFQILITKYSKHV